MTITDGFYTLQIDLNLWLAKTLGLGARTLLPSVLAGLEAAVLSAASRLLDSDIVTLLSGKHAEEHPEDAVLINGLLDCSGSCEEAAAEAVTLTKDRGYGCLKVKVVSLPEAQQSFVNLQICEIIRQNLPCRHLKFL